jgi:hypothetical protein
MKYALGEIRTMGILDRLRVSKNNPVCEVGNRVVSKGEGYSLTTRQVVIESATSDKLKWLAAAALFAFCVAPTFISYRPYLFNAWDDAQYFQRAIGVSRAFWSGNVQGLLAAMVSIRPPAMTLLGLPWGPLASWDDAGRCFITLAVGISFLAALCLYLMMRIGVKPLFLVAASVCVFAAIGPYPHPQADAHVFATGFVADTLFAWTVLAALLLIPYEARIRCTSTGSAVLRGILWGLILSLGVMTKFSFLFFVVIIVPVLLFIRLHQDGLRRTLASLIAFACCSAPSAFYLLRWGQTAYKTAKDYSFGSNAGFFYVPLLPFLHFEIRSSPGMWLSFMLMAAALIYLFIKKRLTQSWPDFLALLIVTGFGIVVLASTNRHIRYEFPAIVALPFLAGILMSGKGRSVSGPYAALTAGLVLCSLVAASMPTRHRPDRQILSRCEAVLAQAVRCNAKHIVLATDSPTLNGDVMDLAMKFSASAISVDNLAYQAMKSVPIEEDFHTISESDQVVFQDRSQLTPAFTNQRVSEYERYIRQGESVPVRVGNDITVYSTRCRP